MFSRRLVIVATLLSYGLILSCSTTPPSDQTSSQGQPALVKEEKNPIGQGMLYRSDLGYEIEFPIDWGKVEVAPNEIVLTEENSSVVVRVAPRENYTRVEQIITDQIATIRGVKMGSSKISGVAQARSASGTDRAGKLVWKLAALHSDCAYVVTGIETPQMRESAESVVRRIISSFKVTKTVSFEEYSRVLITGGKAPWEDNSVAEAHYKEGNQLFDRGDLAGAERTLREASRLDRTQAAPRVQLSRVLAEEKRFDESIAEGRAGIYLKPSDAFAHTILGNAYYQRGVATNYKQGEDVRALEQYEVALRDPNEALAHYGAGMLMARRFGRDTSPVTRRQAQEHLRGYIRLSQRFQSPSDQQRRKLAANMLKALE